MIKVLFKKVLHRKFKMPKKANKNVLSYSKAYKKIKTWKLFFWKRWQHPRKNHCTEVNKTNSQFLKFLTG